MRVHQVSVLPLAITACLTAACASSRPAKPAQAPGPLAPVAFMEGHWKGEADGGTWEEFWTSTEGNVMTGTAKQVVNGRAVFFEFSRIAAAKDGKVTLFVSPFGRHPPTAFTLADTRDDSARFECPQNDYPSVITYTVTGSRTSRVLKATLTGTEKGVAKSETLELRPLK